MGEPGGLPDVYGVAQSWTRLKRLSSSSSIYQACFQCGPEDRRACLCVHARVHVLVCAHVSVRAYRCAFLAHVLFPRQTALAGRGGQGCGSPVAAPPIMSQLLPLRKLFLEERWGLKAQIPCG